MAEEPSRELLQPALLDRLTDDARTISVFDVRTTAADLALAGATQEMLVAALRALGLRDIGVDGDSAASDGAIALRYAAPGRTVSVTQVKTAVLRAPGVHRGSEIQACCEVTAVVRSNAQGSGMESRGITMRRLREFVLRDLSALMNAVNLEACVDLEPYPHVAQSVLNFGIPNLAGVARMSVAPGRLADRIRTAIEVFEPRLSHVRVVPEIDAPRADTVGGLAFRIEAELWGDPLPQHLQVRTQFDLGSGDARVDDLGGR